MSTKGKEKSVKTLNRSSRKALIAAVSVICALLVIIIAFLASKNSIYYSMAKAKAEKNQFSAAAELIENAGGEKAEALAEYITLRTEINSEYPTLLAQLDSEKTALWGETAEKLSNQAELIGNTLAAQAMDISQSLATVNSCIAEYESMRSDILSMMDVFAEINRLHAKGSDGKNTAFTVSEERELLAGWERQNEALARFAASIPNGENLYLLNYLIKEVQGECADISAAIDAVIASGYSETDLVRFSGEGHKSFPSITNDSNESVNVLEKEKYEQFMYKGICRALAESLGKYYLP